MNGARVAWIQVKEPQENYDGLVNVDPNCDTYITFNEPDGYVRQQYQKVVIIPLVED